MGISAVLLGVVAIGYAWPEGIERLVAHVAEWVAARVELP